VTQGEQAWSRLFLAIGPEKEYPKLVLKVWELPQKNLQAAQLKIPIFKPSLLRGQGSQLLEIFTSGSGS